MKMYKINIEILSFHILMKYTCKTVQTLKFPLKHFLFLCYVKVRYSQTMKTERKFLVETLKTPPKWVGVYLHYSDKTQRIRLMIMMIAVNFSRNSLSWQGWVAQQGVLFKVVYSDMKESLRSTHSVWHLT